MVREVKLGTEVLEIIEAIRNGEDFIVLDEKGNYYGILSNEILIRAAFDPKIKIDRFVIRIKPIEFWDIKEVIKKMININSRIIPILEDNKIKIVNIYDVLDKIKDSEVMKEKVKDYMIEDVIKIYYKEPITKAIALMKRKGISRLVVVDEKEKPIGIVTAGDIVRYILTEKEKQKYGEFYGEPFSVEVRSVMSKNLIYVAPDDTLRKAVELLLNNKIFALPVIDKELKGIISAKEILIAYLRFIEKREFQIIIHGIKIDEIDYDWIANRFEKLIRKYSDIIGGNPILILHVKKVRETNIHDNTMRFFVIRGKLLGDKIRLFATEEGVDLYSTINDIIHIFDEELEKRKFKNEKEYLYQRLLKEGMI